MTVTTDTLYAGDPIRMTVAFTDEDGTATDPGAVIFTFVAPDLTITTYTYGVGADVVKDDVGAYHCDKTTTTDQWGTWEGACVGTDPLAKTVSAIWLVQAAL